MALECELCGRNHKTKDCYAKVDINGNYIAQKSGYVKQVMFCNRCGRSNHYERDCRAHTDMNGLYLYEYVESSSEDENFPSCQSCGSFNHNTYYCTKYQYQNKNDKYYDSSEEEFLSKVYDSSDIEDEDVDFCERCGRYSHYTNECFATYDIYNQRIIDIKNKREHCKIPPEIF